jgi:2,5-diketo-D-gluconate reductase B
MPREATAATTVNVQGVEVPKLGLGTWQLTGDDCREAVRDALELGYRHIDTAAAYGNEAEVGQGLVDSAVARDEVFIVTKVSPSDAAPDDVRRSCEASLRALDLDHVDLLLLHWPNADVPLGDTLGALAELREAGSARAIGVSNFTADLLAEALDLAPVLCDQVEFHPYKGQPEVLELARERDVLVAAYSPFAHGDLLAEPALREIGEAHDRTAGPVALRWLLDQPQVCAIPKASSHERRAQNLDVFDFDLSDEQRGAIAGLERV